ncbi:MAG: hypothetical protein FIA94_00745 [Nitrospirae bacterium]|nr:hypothetical protein [Nitrospirota bacterium]
MSEHHDRELNRLEREIIRLRKRLVLLSSPLEVLLKRRGFQVFSKEPAEDLLIPSRRSIDGYYAMMGKYSFRLFLRDVIKHQDFFTGKMVARYATADVTCQYIEYLRSLRLVDVRDTGYAVAGKRVRSFGETLEWYVAEVLRREFSAEAVRGIRFKGRKTGGDYDVIAKMDGELCYVEVKSSPPKQVYEGEISAYLDRIDDLSPEVAIFLMDTELRMKDKIVPMFEAMLAERGKEGVPVVRIEKELFHIGRRIYIINAKDSIAGNIQNVLARYFRDHDDS